MAALMVTCPVCNRSMLPLSLKVHMQMHKRDDKRNKLEEIEKAREIEKNREIEIRPMSKKRKAATVYV